MNCPKANLLRILLVLALLLALSATAYAAPACPADNNTVAASTTYYGQVCAVNDSNGDGVIRIGANSITVDCNGMVLAGNRAGTAIANGGYTGVTIKNCLITDYNVGMWIHSGANSNVLRTNDINRTNYGIHVLASDDANIWDSNIDANNNIGIYVAWDSNRAWIKDNNISDNNYSGISFDTASDGNILQNKIMNNIWIESGTEYGVSLYGSSSNLIKDNNIRRNDRGIYIADSADGLSSVDNNIYMNYIDTNNRIGVDLESGRTAVSDNNISYNFVAGIYISTANVTTAPLSIFRNEISFNGSASGINDGGVRINAGNDANIHDNNVAYNVGNGISVSAASRTIIRDNNIYENSGTNCDPCGGVVLKAVTGDVQDTNIIGNYIYSNRDGISAAEQINRINIWDNNIHMSDSYGMQFSYCRDINVLRTTIRNSGIKDIFLEYDTNILFIDGNFLTATLSEFAAADANTRIDRRWYIDINAVNAFTNLPINGATVDINDQYTTPNYKYGQISRLKLTTSSNGAIATQELTQFDVNSRGTTTFSPYDINVVASSYDSNLNYRITLDSNKNLIIYLSPSAKTVNITSPEAGYSFRGASASFTYSPSASITPVKKYWVRIDSGPWLDNSTSTTYSTSVSAGSHAFSVRALGYDDSNSADANISFAAEFAPGAATCGDGVCGGGETAASCAADCPPICGDGACTGTETPDTCPTDCAVGCGDNVCDDSAGETCSSCPGDCGACTPGEEPPETPGEEGEIQQPGSPFPGEIGRPACAGVQCDDNNPCTTDICFEGECSFINKQEGTTCGFGMECLGSTCVPALLRAAGIPRIPMVTDVASMLVSVLRLLGGDALEKAPLALALLIALAVIAAMLAYNRLRIFMPAEMLSTRQMQALTAARAGVAIAFFVIPFVVNRLVDVNAGITAAIIEIAIILLVHYIKKRSMERKAITV